MRNLVYPDLVIANGLMQLADLMDGLLILGSQSVLLVNKLLILLVERHALFLHFLELNGPGVQMLLERILFFLDCSELVGETAKFIAKRFDLSLEFVDGLDRKLEFNPPLFISLSLDTKWTTFSASISLVFSLSSRR
jgi:hypothetical protein